MDFSKTIKLQPAIVDFQNSGRERNENTQFREHSEFLKLQKACKASSSIHLARYSSSARLNVAASKVQAANNNSPLHTSGNQILDANNNPVTLRGVGIAGMAPDLILWGQRRQQTTGDANGYPLSATAVTDTFQAMSQNWHINMIRVFVYPEWYWQNVHPAATATHKPTYKP